MNRRELQVLAGIRIAEAELLLASSTPCPDGAYYLAGYAVECALKACIAKLVQQHDFPEKKLVIDSHTHDLASLIRLAKLESQLNSEVVANPLFGQYWGIVKDWKETSRYERHSLIKSQNLLNAIANPKDGVLPWIKARW